MKNAILAVLMLLVSAALAKQNPADFNLSARVISAQFNHIPSGGYTNGKTFDLPSDTSGYWSTEIRVGNKVYSANDACKAAKVGSDYPAKIEKDKLELLAGEKVCKYKITGTHDAGAP